MTSNHETLKHLQDQIIDDSQMMIRLTHEAAAGRKVSRQIDELQAAIDVKMALTGGLRRAG